MTEDRLLFKELHLANGITVHARRMDVPFASIRLIIPLGHVHNVAPILPGAAHFLEHMVMKRSLMYPEAGGFEKLVHFRGGNFDASCGIFSTEFSLDIGAEFFPLAFEGFLGQIYEPIFTEEDLSLERSVIINECKRNKRWFPADDALGYHLARKWKSDLRLTMKQLMGDNQDIEATSLEKLVELHRIYLNRDTHLLVGGRFNLEDVCSRVGGFELESYQLPENYGSLQWSHQEYSEETFADVGCPQYFLGGIFSTNLETNFVVRFLGELLTNSVHGALHTWLREEKGWSYGPEFGLESDRLTSNWEICIPINTKEQVIPVRERIHERILKAIQDQTIITREVERGILSSVFSYQTLASIFEDAYGSLVFLGRIITESDYLGLYKRCLDPSYLKETYEKYFSPDVTGEFLALPE